MAGAAVTVVRPAGGPSGDGGGQRLSGSPEAGTEPAQAGSTPRSRVFRALRLRPAPGQRCPLRGSGPALRARAPRPPRPRLREAAPPRRPLCLGASLLLWLLLFRMSRARNEEASCAAQPGLPSTERQRCGEWYSHLQRGPWPTSRTHTPSYKKVQRKETW